MSGYERRKSLLSRSIDTFRKRVQHNKTLRASVYCCCVSTSKPKRSIEDSQHTSQKKLQARAAAYYDRMAELEMNIEEKHRQLLERRQQAEQLQGILGSMTEAAEAQKAFAERVLIERGRAQRVAQEIESLPKLQLQSRKSDLVARQIKCQKYRELISQKLVVTEQLIRQKQQKFEAKKLAIARQQETMQQLCSKAKELRKTKLMNLHLVLILREQILVIRNGKTTNYCYDGNELKDRMFELPNTILREKVLVDSMFFIASHMTPEVRTVLLKHSYFNPELSQIYPKAILGFAFGCDLDYAQTARHKLKTSLKSFQKSFKITASPQIMELFYEAATLIAQWTCWSPQTPTESDHPTLVLSHGASALLFHLELNDRCSLQITSIPAATSRNQ